MLCRHASANFVLTLLAMQNPVMMTNNAAIIATASASFKIFSVVFVSNMKKVSVVPVITTNYVTCRKYKLQNRLIKN